MHNVILALGGNVGNVAKLLNNIPKLLEERGILVNTAISRIYTTGSLLKDDQPDYYNAVCTGTSPLEPLQLLDAIKGIEVELGRKSRGRWGAREIDIDIIDYDNIIFNNERLTLPHYHMHKRSFVLVPMLDLVPQYIHPVLRASVTQMINDLEDTLGIKPMEV